MPVPTPGLVASASDSSRADALPAALRAVTLRIRLLRLLRFESRALCYSALVGIVIVGLSKLNLYALPAPALSVGIVGIGLLIGALIALVPQISDLDVARLTEQRADLKERLSSAVEFRRQGVSASEPFYGEQWADANRYAAGVDIKKLYPLKLPMQLPLGLLLCLGLFAIYFVPALVVKMSPAHKAEVAEVKTQGMHIVKVAQDAQKAADQQKLTETKKAAEEARKLGEAMQKGKMSKKQSLVALQKLTKKMEDQQRKIADKAAPKSLEEAGKELKKALDKMQKDAEQARKEKEAQKAQQNMQARDLKKPGQKPGDDKQTPPKESEAMKQAKAAMQQMANALAEQNTQKMQQAMEQMAKSMEKGDMSKEEMQQLQQAMQKMAEALKDTQQSLSGQQMQQLAEQMQNMNSMDPQTLQQMAAMMHQISKGMGKPSGQLSTAMLDAKSLSELEEALKEGRLTTSLPGDKPGNGPGNGGKGWNGSGHESKPMPNPAKTNPRLQVASKGDKIKAVGKNGSMKEFVKYLSMPAKPSKYLPNGQIKGNRLENGQELQTQTTGDPDPTHSNSPYYNAVETSRKQAESTLNKENIPATMKKQVKDYFNSLPAH